MTTLDELRRTPWSHPALDLPSIASTIRPVVPVEPSLPIVPGAYARGPNPNDSLVIGRSIRDPDLAPRLGDDPKAQAAFQSLTNPVTLQPPVPAPLLRLAIPDPFATLNASRLPTTDLDRDAPTVQLDRPAPPGLK